MTFLIRPHTPGDLPALVAALAELHRVSHYPSVWPADPGAFVAPVGACGWLAEEPEGGPQAGVLGNVVLRDLPQPPGWLPGGASGERPLALVGRLFVVPAARGRGVGRALLRAAQQAAQARGRRAALEVSAAALPATKLYEAEGWQRLTTQAAHWQEADGSVPQMHVYLAPAGSASGGK
ncbi:GNAT family N-acetyltransferase [Deinococcus lacus]|uniref:GNAT family N-acetyltransferase n=1 Tax=Deinococcus lacus TaxID=392561 RepID=A0ABW1YFM1_9DEIO